MDSFQSSRWLFTKDGDDAHLYRAVPYRIRGLVDKFTGLDIINCTPTNEKCVVGPRECAVYQVDRLPFQLRIQEVTRRMAKEMIIYLVELVAECIKHKIAIHDINESNVLYWNRPIYVDLDSVRGPNTKTYAGSAARIAYLFNKYVRKKSIKETVGSYNLAAMGRDGGMFGGVHERWKSINWGAVKTWQSLKRLIQKTRIPPLKSHWGDVYGPYHNNHDKMIEENIKIRGALKLLRQAKPTTILDIGCNKGYLCDMASEFSHGVVGFDIDEKCVDIANESYRQNNKVNFAHFGIMHLSQDKRFVQHRYCADAVVALAVTHHFQNAKMDAKVIAALMAKLAKRLIIIEDIADVGSYHHVFKNRGFGLLERIQSHPANRYLSLFARL
jgi:hypothetical protein